MSEVLPIKIEKMRIVKYPSKRNNYRRYKNAEWKWEEVFNEIEKVKGDCDNYIKLISEKYNIPYRTLTRKYNLWKNNNVDNNENRGGHNKIFSEEEERNLYNYIVNVFINCNLLFNNDHLKLLAIQQYHMLQKEKNKEYITEESFSISDGWVTDYKKKWKLSSLKTKLNKKATKTDPNELVTFLGECTNITKEVENKYIYNLDETFWRTNSAYSKVIGIQNSDSRKVDSNINEKEGFTAIFIISAAGVFMKPIIIMKGTTKRSLKKIESVNDNDINKKYSRSGWINVNILIQLLKDINANANGNKAALILDKYGAHTDDLVIEEAKKLNISLIYVPGKHLQTNH